MVQELDDTFNAAMMIGYHSKAGSDGNPLAHTITTRLSGIKFNGRYASEFLIHAYAAALVSVPLVFLSGDENICAEAESYISHISTVAVKNGRGDSTTSIQPTLALEKIKKGVKKALQGDLRACLPGLPKTFQVEVIYKEHAAAHKASFYPGASLKEPHAIAFETDDYFEVLRLLSFVI
jgi:D-amino peptidase